MEFVDVVYGLCRERRRSTEERREIEFCAEKNQVWSLFIAKGQMVILLILSTPLGLLKFWIDEGVSL